MVRNRKEILEMASIQGIAIDFLFFILIVVLQILTGGMPVLIGLVAIYCIYRYGKREMFEKAIGGKKEEFELGEDFSETEMALVNNILDNNRLQYAFQPIVSAKDGSIYAYESLMRSDTDTAISPIRILKYAERCNRSYDVERLTLFNSLAKFANSDQVPLGAKIFINSIPGHFLTESDFMALRKRFGAVLGNMVLEITEQRDLDDDSLVLLNTRRESAGFSLAIDDYGSGCSNTNNLLRYMPQVVKIDRLLITGIDRNAKKRFFVSSLISFAKDNDMLTLAEGVETESELRTVVRLGVDLIQGYVTAKPTVEIVSEIPEDIRRIIVNENLKVGDNPRAAYTADKCGELSTFELATQKYTKINISATNLTLTGSDEYTADMTISIKDNTDCYLTLSNVQLNAVDDKPCIEVGENCHLTINLQGNNRLNSKGIYVPEGSSLLVIGSGYLMINVKGHECYAIGTDSQTAFGRIELKCAGRIELNVDGERCVGVGGGLASANSELILAVGKVKLTVAGVDAVGIGAHRGDVRIRFLDMTFESVFRVGGGTVIGSLDGRMDIVVRNYRFDIQGSGRELAVFGNTATASGIIEMHNGSFKAVFNGHCIYFFGGKDGDITLNYSHSNISILGEGDFITGFGTRDEKASVSIEECGVELTINASSPLAVGASERILTKCDLTKEFHINGVSELIGKFMKVVG